MTEMLKLPGWKVFSKFDSYAKDSNEKRAHVRTDMQYKQKNGN